MKTALLAERAARSASEARYEREVSLHAAAEERLRQEVERRLEAEHNVQDLETQVAVLMGVGKKTAGAKRKVYRRGDAHASQASTAAQPPKHTAGEKPSVVQGSSGLLRQSQETSRRRVNLNGKVE